MMAYSATTLGSEVVEKEILIEMLRRMWLIRQLDTAARRFVSLGEVPGIIHLEDGQEGEMVGSCMAVEAEDYVFTTHRCHGHPIARGSRPGPVLAELMGKATGVCRGKGGSQHLADRSVGLLLGSAILGGAVPWAVGAALACKLKGEQRVVLACFGEGASNEGSVHEAMNLASIWELPVVFFCENNGYQVTVSATYGLAVDDVADRAVGYGMPGQVVDGQDAVAVYGAVNAAAARARQGGGPSLIEAKTYRYCEHAENLLLIVDPYRSDEEVQEWRKRDPIVIMRERLLQDGLIGENEADAIEAETHAEVEEAAQFALDSPYPTPDALFEDLYSTPIREVAI